MSIRLQLSSIRPMLPRRYSAAIVRFAVHASTRHLVLQGRMQVLAQVQREISLGGLAQGRLAQQQRPHHPKHQLGLADLGLCCQTQVAENHRWHERAALLGRRHRRRVAPAGRLDERLEVVPQRGVTHLDQWAPGPGSLDPTRRDGRLIDHSPVITNR